MPTPTDALIAKVNKKLGSPVLVKGSDLKHVTFQRTSTGSFSFDVMLGGGWPLNCWNEVIGNESHGKTAMVIKTIAAAQNANEDHETLWIASEDFNIPWAETLGVDMDRVTLALTNAMEEAYEIVIEAYLERSVDAIVIDSYPALIPTSEFEGDIADWLPGLGARLTNKFMRKSSTAQRRSLTEDDRPCLGIVINQWREKIGVMMGDPRTTPGGKGKNFQYLTRVEVVRQDWLEDGSGKQKVKVGQTIKAQTIKNKTAPPRRIGQVDFYFADAKPFSAGDYDRGKELGTIGVAWDIIEKHGSWFHYQGEKWNGWEPMFLQLREDLDLQDHLMAQVNRVVNHVIEVPETKRRIRRKK